MKLVLDSSIVIDHLRTKKLSTAFFDAWNSHDFMISLVTVAELYSGKSVQSPGPARRELEDILSGIEVVSLTLTTVKRVGDLRARYQLSLGDAFVAVLAIEQQSQVLTLDRKDFEKVKEITLYRLDRIKRKSWR